jgi:hypothetical protein
MVRRGLTVPPGPPHGSRIERERGPCMAQHPLGRVLFTQQSALAGVGANSSSAIDIHDVTNLWLAAYATGSATGTSPTVTVQLDLFDNFNNVFPAVLTLTAIAGAPGHASGSCGLNTSNLTLPMSCQVTWTLGGTSPAFTNVDITLIGR